MIIIPERYNNCCLLWRKLLLPVLLLSLVCSSNLFALSGGNWSQEVGYYTIRPDVDSSEVSGPGLPPDTAVNVEDGESFVLTTTYHYNNNLSFEFFYSTWKELDVTAAGSIASLGEIGSIEYLAPTVMANWTFGGRNWVVRPYLGIGINRMIYGNEQANSTLEAALGGSTDVELEDTWGAVFTGGLTYDITDQVYVSAAYVQIKTDTQATLTTDAVGTQRTVDLDTDLRISYLNVGYHF